MLTTVFLAPNVLAEEESPDEAEEESPDEAEEEAAEDGADGLSLDELDALCQQLRAEELEERRTAAEAIIASGPSSVSAIRHRLRRDLRAAPQELQELLDGLSPDVRGRRLPRFTEDEPFDILPPLLDADRDGTVAERAATDATEVVTLLRALTEARSSNATRLMVRYGVRELGVFRAELARNMQRLGDQAIPALLRTTQHPNENVAQLAVDLLEWLSRTTPGRQVQVRDSNTLAEILTVYGEIANRDTIPVLLSFSGSEVAIVRQAARASLMEYGRTILWPARIKYENFTGEEPSRRWSWQELARNLFEAQDAARIAQAERTMSEGLRFARENRFEQMTERFDLILARWPQYERRQEMIPGLAAYAESLEEEGEHERARQLRQRILLLAPEGPQADELRSQLILDHAERSLARGIADPAPIGELEELGHHREDAQRLRSRINERLEGISARTYRLFSAAGLVLFGFAIFGFLFFRVLGRAPATEESAVGKGPKGPSDSPRGSLDNVGENEEADGGGGRDEADDDGGRRDEADDGGERDEADDGERDEADDDGGRDEADGDGGGREEDSSSRN